MGIIHNTVDFCYDEPPPRIAFHEGIIVVSSSETFFLTVKTLAFQLDSEKGCPVDCLSPGFLPFPVRPDSVLREPFSGAAFSQKNREPWQVTFHIDSSQTLFVRTTCSPPPFTVQSSNPFPDSSVFFRNPPLSQVRDPITRSSMSLIAPIISNYRPPYVLDDVH